MPIPEDDADKETRAVDDYIQRVRLRAYLISEREVAQEEDAAGLRAGRQYDEDLKQFESSGRVEQAAKAAREALEGPERDQLEWAQEAARRASRGEDKGSRR